jgi:hypothetical protein
VILDLEPEFEIVLPPVPGRAMAARPGETPESDHPPLIEAANAGPRLGFMQAPQVYCGQPSAGPGRKARHLPAVSLGAGLVRKYEAEKMYGLRRDNGAMKLKKLTHRHYEVIMRHLAGQSGEQIHIGMGLSISTISRILNDPLSQVQLKRSYKDRQAELDALAGKAIGAVRHALDLGSTSEKLAAVDKYSKLKQSIAPESNPMESAEDYARAIVSNAQNVQINFHGRQ